MENGERNIITLPPDIRSRIFSLLDPKDLCFLAQSCRSMYECLGEHWDKYFEGYFGKNGSTSNSIGKLLSSNQAKLFWAAERGYRTFVEKLLTDYNNPNCPLTVETSDNGTTCLHLASANGRHELVKYLFSIGAKVDQKNKREATPLFLAAERNHVQVAQLLLENGADIEAATAAKEKPLFIAIQNGNKEMARFLLDRKAKVNSDETAAVGDRFMEQPTVDSSPLMIAAQNGNIDLVLMLLEAGANLEAKNRNGATPLYLAASSGHLEVVKALIEHGAKIDEATNNGVTPLFVSGSKKHGEVVDYLLSQNADIEQALEYSVNNPFLIQRYREWTSSLEDAKHQPAGCGPCIIA